MGIGHSSTAAVTAFAASAAVLLQSAANPGAAAFVVPPGLGRARPLPPLLRPLGSTSSTPPRWADPTDEADRPRSATPPAATATAPVVRPPAAGAAAAADDDDDVKLSADAEALVEKLMARRAAREEKQRQRQRQEAEAPSPVTLDDETYEDLLGSVVAASAAATEPPRGGAHVEIAQEEKDRSTTSSARRREEEAFHRSLLEARLRFDASSAPSEPPRQVVAHAEIAQEEGQQGRSMSARREEEEAFQRSLLEARLQLGASSAQVAHVEIAQEDGQEGRSIMTLREEESFQRSLLEARLAFEAASSAPSSETQDREVLANEEEGSAALRRQQQREEAFQRSLLEARLRFDEAKSSPPEEVQVQEEVGASMETEKGAQKQQRQEVPIARLDLDQDQKEQQQQQQRRQREEEFQRSLLEARLSLEANNSSQKKDERQHQHPEVPTPVVVGLTDDAYEDLVGSVASAVDAAAEAARHNEEVWAGRSHDGSDDGGEEEGGGIEAAAAPTTTATTATTATTLDEERSRLATDAVRIVDAARMDEAEGRFGESVQIVTNEDHIEDALLGEDGTGLLAKEADRIADRVLLAEEERLVAEEEEASGRADDNAEEEVRIIEDAIAVSAQPAGVELVVLPDAERAAGGGGEEGRGGGTAAMMGGPAPVEVAESLLDEPLWSVEGSTVPAAAAPSADVAPAVAEETEEERENRPDEEHLAVTAVIQEPDMREEEKQQQQLVVGIAEDSEAQIEDAIAVSAQPAGVERVVLPDAEPAAGEGEGEKERTTAMEQPVEVAQSPPDQPWWSVDNSALPAARPIKSAPDEAEKKEKQPDAEMVVAAADTQEALADESKHEEEKEREPDVEPVVATAVIREAVADESKQTEEVKDKEKQRDVELAVTAAANQEAMTDETERLQQQQQEGELFKPKPKTSFWRTISPSDISDALVTTLAPEKGVLQFMNDPEIEIIKFAASHLVRAVIDGGRAAVLAFIATIETAGSPEIAHAVRNTASKAGDAARSGAQVGPVVAGALGEATGTFLRRLGAAEATRAAAAATAQSTNQFSSFTAACAALALKQGRKAPEYADLLKAKLNDAQRKAEEARAAEEEKQRLEEERLAAEIKIEEERIAAERKAMEEIKLRAEAEKKRVDEKRVAAEKLALENIRRNAEEEKRRLEKERVETTNIIKEDNGKGIIKIESEERKGAKAFFFAEE